MRYLKSIASKIRIIFRSTFTPEKIEMIGYENPVLVEEIVTKTLARSLELKKNVPLTIPEIRTAVGFIMLQNRVQLRVLDLGGGAGTHFDTLKRIFPHTQIDYYVIETKEMVRQASKKRVSIEGLTFLSDPESPTLRGDFDLMLANGSIQYLPNADKTLKQILKLKPKNIFITRTPLTCDAETVHIDQISRLVDNGPFGGASHSSALVSYEANVLPLKDFTKIFSEDYKELFSIQEEQSPFGHEHPKINSWGFFFVLI
jgi:putative methyltransferase (TIGR04325 family)